MRGTLPPEIGMVSTLREVTLSDNLLSGTIPQDFECLSELDTLVISFNLLTGTIPHFVWTKFPDMVHLDLSYNFFKGSIPDNTIAAKQPKMKVLFLENNDLTGSIPKDIGELAKMRRLHLDGNMLKGPIPSNIHTPKMEELNLHNNQLTGTFPATDFVNDIATGKSKLTEVTLHNNKLADQNVEDMCGLTKSGKLTTFTADPNVQGSCVTPGV